MGITLSVIQKMQSLGLFGAGRIAILDIGSSNLYQASRQGVEDFLRVNGVPSSEGSDMFALKMEAGSAYDPVRGGTNDAFAGELFEMAGMRYLSIDIAAGYKTTILDLNHQLTPDSFFNAFDLVLNFGTTEHLLNQYNALKVIHDSAKVGGYMVHQLPCVGYVNHGYFCYTPRCMFELASYNRYELVAFWFDGPGSLNDLFAPIRDYRQYFPALSSTLQDKDAAGGANQIDTLAIRDVAINVVFRKVQDRPFAGALERSTSVGDVPASVSAGYDHPGLPARGGRSLTRIKRFLRPLRAYMAVRVRGNLRKG